MHIAICEDTRDDLNTLRPMLNAAFSAAHVEARFDVFTDGESMLAAMEAGCEWQVCFLDIYMPGLTGVAVAEAVRARHPDTVFVFTTTSPEHMADGFRLGAAHYLLKPFAQADVSEAIHRALRMVGRLGRYIELLVDRQLRKIPLDSIRYMESKDHATLLYTTGGKLRTYTPLEEVEAMLSGAPFLRCHRSYVVALPRVRRALPESFEMDDGSIVPLRRENRAALKDAWYDWCIEHTRGRE